MRRVVLLFAVVVGPLGCAADHMRSIHPAGPIAFAPREATIVFVRPQAVPAAIRYTLVDVTGRRAARFLGEAEPSSHFAVTVPPGKHVFVGFGGGDADAVQADLLEGRVYFVAVTKWFFGPMHLVAVNHASPEWSQVHGWLDETTQLVSEREAGQSDLVREPESLDDTIGEALDALKEYDEEELAQRTLSAEDGAR